MENFSSHSPLRTKSEFYVFRRRLGIILSNLSIVFAVLSLFGLFSIFSVIFIFLLWLTVLLVTLGFIIKYIPNYFELLGKLVEFSITSVKFFYSHLLLFAGISAVSLICSTILLRLDRERTHTARIVCSWIITVVFIIGALLYFWWVKNENS